MTEIGFETQQTEDGSLTFYSPEFEETFHSKYGAKKEAFITHVKGCNLLEKARNQSSLKIIDICYGLGYNSAQAIDSIWSINPECRIEIMALEIDETVIFQAIENKLLNIWDDYIVDLLTELANKKYVSKHNLKVQLFVEDARVTMPKLVHKNFKADAIFLDPFSPPKCPQLWTMEFFSLLAKCLNSKGKIATYSCSACVRKAFQLNGLYIGRNYVVGKRQPGTVASFEQENLTPLSLREKEHLQTRASIPYRDPFLNDCKEVIVQRRKDEQIISVLESTSQWKKRWLS